MYIFIFDKNQLEAVGPGYFPTKLKKVVSRQTILTNSIPSFYGLSPELTNLLSSHTSSVYFERGASIFDMGKPVQPFLLLISGAMRVQSVSDMGSEVLLCRVNAVKGCILVPTCSFVETGHAAEGIAETDIEAVLIPEKTFNDILAVSREFRAMVFAAYANRMTDVFTAIEHAAFEHADTWGFLKQGELNHPSGPVHIRH